MTSYPVQMQPVGQVGMDVPVKFGDSSSNGSRDIQQRSGRMRHFRPFLSKTRKRFRLMLSSRSADFFNISETIRASDFKIYDKVALDILNISTGNGAINYFRLA